MKQLLLSLMLVSGCCGEGCLLSPWMPPPTSTDFSPNLKGCACAIDYQDMLVVLSDWGDCVPDSCCRTDLDRDGTVGTEDLLRVLDGWGT
jgi:hypothetical protein